LIDFFEFTYRVPEDNIKVIKNPDLQTVEQAWAQLNATIASNKEKKYFVLSIFTGHGMNIDGFGTMPLNEYDEKTHFYKMFPFERSIKQCAVDNPNSYHLGVFSLCRVTYLVEDYYNICFAASDAQARLQEALEK